MHRCSRNPVHPHAVCCSITTGTQIQVKVRSVGANGAGHSLWSDLVAVTVPGHLEQPPQPPASTASEASEAPKRRRRKAAHDRELEQADPKRSEHLNLVQSAVHSGPLTQPHSSL